MTGDLLLTIGVPAILIAVLGIIVVNWAITGSRPKETLSAFTPIAKVMPIYPHPFVRKPNPYPSDDSGYREGWYHHDGGPCPVKPDTIVQVPSGTYHSPTGVFTHQASELVWEWEKTRAVRDNIQSFRVVPLAELQPHPSHKDITLILFEDGLTITCGDCGIRGYHNLSQPCTKESTNAN